MANMNWVLFAWSFGYGLLIAAIFYRVGHANGYNKYRREWMALSQAVQSQKACHE